MNIYLCGFLFAPGQPVVHADRGGHEQHDAEHDIVDDAKCHGPVVRLGTRSLKTRVQTYDDYDDGDDDNVLLMLAVRDNSTDHGLSGAAAMGGGSTRVLN